MLQPVDISGGQVSGVDSLSSAASLVRNLETDESGINRVRPSLTTYTVSTFTANQLIGLEKWKDKTIGVTINASDLVKSMWYIHDLVPDNAHALSDSTAATQVGGADASRRAVFALGDNHVYVTAGGQIQRWGPSIALSETLASSPRCTHIAIMGQRLISNDLENPQG